MFYLAKLDLPRFPHAIDLTNSPDTLRFLNFVRHIYMQSGSQKKFIFTDTEWNRERSQEISSQQRNVPPMTLRSASVYCMQCQKHWTAQVYKGSSLEPILFKLIVTCPECGASESVPQSEIPYEQN